MIDLIVALAVVVAAPNPRVAVVAPVATRGVASIHVDAAAQQVRQAAAGDSDIEVVDLESDCRGLDCVGPARGRCEHLLLTTLRARGGELEARVELVEVRSGDVLFVSLNSAPLSFGTATLDLPLLVADVLAELTAPTRRPPERAEQQVVHTEPEPALRAEPESAPAAPARRTGLAAPRSEPVPREGIWIGNCVSHPELGADVFLDPDDWERYRRYRKSARHPLPVRRWITEQNKESWALNFAWITPPVVLALGLIVDSSDLSKAGGYTLPVAAIAAILDAADLGTIDYCKLGRRR